MNARQATRGGRIFTIAPGLPFLRTLAQDLLEGRLVAGFRHDPAAPLSLSKMTILVPTRRSARALRAEFADLLGGEAAILPVIRTLGETEEDADYLDNLPVEGLDLAPPITATVRQLELARLILAWRNRLPEIVRNIHPDAPLVAPASPADAVWLARALVELIDSVETEEIDWAALDELDARDHAAWWQLTLEFLHIAIAFWPERLKELRRSSPARHRNGALAAEARRLARFEGPLIVAGSTGSIPAAAGLIAAVHAHPQGVVVLPGLDLSLSDEAWDTVDPVPVAGRFAEPATRAHPQFELSRLLSRLAITRGDVVAIGHEPQALADRSIVLSQAMVPAAMTDRWNDWRAAFGADRLAVAFADVALIETANEREEATAIAIALRLALEKPGRSGESLAALITPDRALARRVAAELARFGIFADDSAGVPFVAAQQGILLKLLLEATLRPGDPVTIMALLKHPLARFGLEDGEYRRLVDLLELLCLRGGVRGLDLAELAPYLRQRLQAEAASRRRPQWRAAIDDADLEAVEGLAQRIASAVEPLTAALARSHAERRALRIERSLQDWAERTGRALEALALDPEAGLTGLWGDEGGEKLAELLGEILEADGTIEADGPQFVDIVDALMVGAAVKPRALRHPRVFIFGTLEARLQAVDTMVIGGMNEGSWPGQAANNPFLSRLMKTQMGLEPPERRVGQQAHDFAMAHGAPMLIYSRALKQGGAPTVASRWLQRLAALGGKDFIESLRQRGEDYRHFAEKIDQGASQRPAQRPEPRPPLALQPKSFSFSEVGRLRRDPYSVYARRVLRLDPIEPFNADPGAAERGTLYHAIVDRFVREGHDPAAPQSARILDSITDELFDGEALPAHIDVVWRMRFREVASQFLSWEQQRRETIARSATEAWGEMPIADLGVRLTGIADRIDVKPGGRADIVDYKTGSSPSTAQARSLLDPQLALEAAALQAGAFKATGRLVAENLVYVRLRPGGRFKAEAVNNEFSGKNPKSAADLAGDSLAQLTGLVRLLQSGERGFVSRLIPEQMNAFGGDYDHLARVAEWSTAEPGEGTADE